METTLRQELDARGLHGIRGVFVVPGATATQAADAVARADADVKAGRAFPCVNLDGDLGPVRSWVVHASEDAFFRHRLSTRRPLGWLLAALAKLVAAQPYRGR